MITSQKTAFLSEVSSEFDVIPADKRTYLSDRLRHRLYDLILSEFMKHQKDNPGFTQAALARRIGSRPEIVNRWLSSPGNWTLDTISNLLAGISGAELGISVNRLADYPKANLSRPDWLDNDRDRKTYNVPTQAVAVFVVNPSANIMRGIDTKESPNG
jgi:hypothetical protein